MSSNRSKFLCLLGFLFMGGVICHSLDAASKNKSAKKLKKNAVKTSYTWDSHPSFEKVYEGYKPPFRTPTSPKIEKYSQQTTYNNNSFVQTEAQIDPILKKAGKLISKNEFRKATVLYRRILDQYSNSLHRVAEEGIFIPSILYAQRKILKYTRKELTYYRVLFDPAAKEIYDRAVRRYSIFDYKDLVNLHLATSYGDDALFALANASLDNGDYDQARSYYERIVTYHGAEDKDQDSIELNRDQVWVRLAICFKHLGNDSGYKAVLKKIKNKKEGTVSRLLANLAKFRYDDFAVRQRESRRSARFDALDDRRLSEPMPYPLSENRGQWKADLPARPEMYPLNVAQEAMPWATETDLIYKDLNTLYSRSLLTGKLNWTFGPGGASFDWDRYNSGRKGRLNATFYPEQPLLVHDGVVLSHMYVYGASLVAVDQSTGRLLWSKGPMGAVTDSDWLDRYQASPAGGRGKVFVPVVHDDIRGKSHVASTAELVAYETRSGKLLWRTWLARITPLKITQSRYPRKIRIFSSPPVLNEGTVYQLTNAGVLGAVDAENGDIRWLSRYPQLEKTLDNFENPGQIWTNEAPLIYGDKIFITPLDSKFLICMDKHTGKVIWTSTQTMDSTFNARKGGFPQVWRLNGLTADGLLCLTGKDVVFLHPEDGTLAWKVGMNEHILSKSVDTRLAPKGLEAGITGELKDFWIGTGKVYGKPKLTRDNKLYFSMQGWFFGPSPVQGPFNSEYCLNLKTRELTWQRRWYHKRAFIFNHQRALPVAKRVINEEEEPYHPASRMSFTRWGVPFEVDVTSKRIVVRYDQEKIEKALKDTKDLNTLFAKAEMALLKGQVEESIKLYEQCKPLLPSEEEDRRRDINLRLYPLYMELARWGHEEQNLTLLENACKNMGATASNPTQEIRALMAHAELHELKGDYTKALQVLQNASRHYWRELLWVSPIEINDPEPLRKKMDASLKNLISEIPAPYAGYGKELSGWESLVLNDYFLAVASLPKSVEVETRSFIAGRIRALLKRAPAKFRKEYEEMASIDLKKYEDPAVGERLLWCWPESSAAKKRAVELVAGMASLPSIDRQAELWKFGDLAKACGLGVELIPDGRKSLFQKSRQAELASGSSAVQHEAKTKDSEIVRLLLPQKGEAKKTTDLLFVAGRRKQSYGNRFMLSCWDMKANKLIWDSREILLKGGGGLETGFEEAFIHGSQVIVHGSYDVISMDWTAGTSLDKKGRKEKKWHFRVPMGFEIKSVGLRGDLLILLGRSSTLALNAQSGTIVWETPERGDFYEGPFFNADVLFTVRKNPAAVSFRDLGSGRQRRRIALPGLSNNRKHPIFSGESSTDSASASESAEAYPVAYGEGHLAVSDGLSYHVVDVNKEILIWSRPAAELDMSAQAGFRFWIDGGKLFVLKPYYSVLANVLFDLKTGDLLWKRREGGDKASSKLRKLKTEGEKDASAGLVLSSVTFCDNKAYGIKYEVSSSKVTLVGMDTNSGNEIMKVSKGGYGTPEAYVEASLSKDCVVVRIQDGNNFELWQVNVKTGKIVQETKLEGYGRLGAYGDASIVWQGPNLAIWTYQNRKWSSE